MQFDLTSGCRLEKGLGPGEVLRSEPQQRVHPVYSDGDWIWCATEMCAGLLRLHAESSHLSCTTVNCSQMIPSREHAGCT
jgi:hypothetical protein